MPTLIGLTGRKRAGKDTAAAGLEGFARVALADPLRAVLERFDPIVAPANLPRLHTVTARRPLAAATAAIGLQAAVAAELPETGVAFSRRVAADPRISTRSIAILDPLVAPEGPGPRPIRLSDALVEGWEVAKQRYPEVRRLMQVLGTDVMRRLHDDHVWVEEARAVITGLMNAGHDVVVTDVRFDDEAAMVHDLDGRIVRIIRPDLGTNTDTHPSEAGIAPGLVDATVVNDGTTERLRTSMRAVILLISSTPRIAS